MPGRWKSLETEDRLKLVYVPVTIALLTSLIALGIARLPSLFDDSGPELTLVDTVLANSWRYEDRFKPHLEVKLHNKGDRRAVLVRLQATVMRAVYFPSCIFYGGSGTYETGQYSVKLPWRAKPGLRRTMALNQEIGPDEVDRFRVGFETPRSEYGMAFLYELRLAVEYEDGSKPFPLGKYLVMTPLALPHESWNSRFAHGVRAQSLAASPYGDNDSARCFRRNREAMAPFMTSRAARSQSVAAVLRYVRMS